MKIKKLLVLGLVTGVVFSSLGVAEAAKKKKPKPVPVPAQADQTFFMRRDACTGDEADNARLSITDGTEPADGNQCGFLDYGVMNEVYVASGDTAVSDAWPAVDGLPLVLDATKPITGTINMYSSYLGDPLPAEVGVAAGQVEMVIDITGVSAGEDIVVGTAMVEYQVTPGTALYEVKFEIKPGAELDKKSFEEFVLTTTVRGPNALHGLYELDNPASTVIVPSWVTPAA